MDSIIEKSRLIDKDYDEEMIKFYRENRVYFDNFNIITDIETIEEIILIKQKYCEAIERKGYYKELTVVLSHIFILLDKIKSKSLKNHQSYERALFYEGIVLARQNKYSVSNHRFKELKIIDPKNESYENWYQSNKKKNSNNIFSLWENIIMIITVFTAFFGHNIFGNTNIIILIIVFVLFVGTFFYTLVLRKKTTKSND